MRSAPSPVLAAALSLVFPGLGQAYSGRIARGAVLALPAILVVLAVLTLVSGGTRSVLGFLLNPSGILLLLGGGATFAVYHFIVIVDAYLFAGRTPGRSLARRRRPVGPLVALVALALVVHGLPWYYAFRAAPNLAAIFHAGEPPTDWSVPSPSWAADASASAGVAPVPGASGKSPAPGTAVAQPSGASSPTPGTVQPSAAGSSGSPTPTPFSGPAWARDGQLNVVLLGSDEGPGRWSLRPDAIFLLSVDIATAEAALFGFPRYMSNIPLPPETAVNFREGRYPGYINALYVAAQNNPRRYPGNDARGLRVVAGAVQELAGVEVDHYVMANLNGFVQVIDAMGGMWVDVPEPGVSDDRYVPEWGRGHLRVRLRPGCRKLDGTMALAFVRSRHQDSDIHRLARQQVAIAALRRQFDPLEVVPELPDLFDVAGENLHWTLQPDDVAPIAELAGRVDPDRIRTVIFSPPEFKRELNDERIEKIRAKVRGIFEEQDPELSGDVAGEDCPPD